MTNPNTSTFFPITATHDHDAVVEMEGGRRVRSVEYREGDNR